MTLIHAPNDGNADVATAPHRPAPRPNEEAAPTEDLFPEAKRRERKRRLIVIAAIVVVLGGTGVGYVVSRSKAPTSRRAAPRLTITTPPIATASIVTPQHPYGLAVGPNGDLYVIDSGRDQILRRLTSGKFQVVAGNGKRGFSGDGGPAVNAEIHLEYSSGIAIAKNGTVYFADTWNGRVREVLPDGIIKTAIGGGTRTIGQGSMPARSVALSKAFTVAGLTIGPNGELYVAANDVYRLAPDGVLHWVVGEPFNPKQWRKGSGGVYANPAVQNDFSSAERLAFDGRGDLLVAGGGGWGLYERTTTGKLRFLETFRGDGFWGSLAEAPNGSVVLSDRGGFSRFISTGAIVQVIPQPVGNKTSPLDAALGRMNGGPLENTFLGGDGVAVGSAGQIYGDVNTGSTFTSVNAILQVNTNGTVITLWKS